MTTHATPISSASPSASRWQPQPPVTWQPTPVQQCLLTATVGQGIAALNAWQIWQAQVDIENLDEGSYWILPRLYHSLRQVDQVDLSPEALQKLQRIKGVYRHVWSRNQILLRLLEKAVQTLQQAGISPVVLGGAALVTRPGADVGSRRVDDMGLWVPFETLPLAIAQLWEAGWQPTQRLEVNQLRSQQTFLGWQQNGYTLVLYWRVLPEFSSLGVAGDSLTEAETVQLGHTSVLALDPTDQFLLCCIQATQWQPRPPFYWLADAAALAQNFTIDGPRLKEKAQTHQLTLALRESLSVIVPLLNHLNQSALTALEQELNHSAISPYEQWEFAAKAQPHPLLGQLPRHWFEYRRLHPHQSQIRCWQGYLRFLRQRWGIRIWHVSIIFKRLSRLVSGKH